MPPNDSEEVGIVRKRVYVGNLPTEITLYEFLKLIPFGCEVTNIEVKQKNNIDGDPSTSFAFLTVNGTLSCIKSWCRSFSKKSFKGHKVTVEFAKESFLDRLQKELKKAEHKAESSHVCLSPCKRLIESGITISEPKSKRHKKSKSVKPLPILEQPDIKPPDLPTTDTSAKILNDTNYDAEARRKKSLAERCSLYLNQVETVKESLGSSKKHNNKIVFHEDIEEQIPEQVLAMNVNEEATLSNDSSSRVKKPTLFDSCEESDHDEKYDFSATKHFYKTVETIYSTLDERFRLDKRFLEEPVDEVSTDNKQKENEGSDDDKQINNIISSIIGESVVKKKLVNNKLPARFNPMITDHEQYLVPPGDPSNDLSKDIKEKENEESFKVTNEKFYHVSDKLAQTFKKEEDTNKFSLLGIFGDSNNESTSKNEEQTSVNMVGQRFFYVTNEVEDNSAEQNGHILNKSSGEIVKESQESHGNSESFFFHEDDERLKASLQFFKKPLEKSEPYSVRRNKIKKIINTKYKKNVGRVGSFSTKLGGNKRKKIGQKRMVNKTRKK